LSLELDAGGDLLVSANESGRSALRRFRAAGECPHCVVESTLRTFVTREPVDEIGFYRAETAAGAGCAAYIYFEQPNVRMDITPSGSAPPPAGAGCAVHSR
jgi:hypothetical protein